MPLSISKDILFVSTPSHAHPFMGPLKDSGFNVIIKENFDAAFAEAQKLKPAIIVFYLPQYWQNITEFVKKLRAIPEFETTPMVYIGGMIEGQDQEVIRSLGVKTLTKGPLPELEMVRFMVKLANG